eukprot:5655311-Pleurochrysis_carterae.AAC.1
MVSCTNESAPVYSAPTTILLLCRAHRREGDDSACMARGLGVNATTTQRNAGGRLPSMDELELGMREIDLVHWQESQSLGSDILILITDMIPPHLRSNYVCEIYAKGLFRSMQAQKSCSCRLNLASDDLLVNHQQRLCFGACQNAALNHSLQQRATRAANDSLTN